MNFYARAVRARCIHTPLNLESNHSPARRNKVRLPVLATGLSVNQLCAFFSALVDYFNLQNFHCSAP
jgi:hypothetical protein